MRTSLGWGVIAAILTIWTALGTAAQTPAQPAGSQLVAVGAGSAAEQVVVITLKGKIDRITTASLQRRIAEAGMLAKRSSTALVFEIDSDQVDMGTGQELANAISNSGVTNTTAWINTRCTGGAVIVALSCRWILIPPAPVPVSFGDAFRVSAGQFKGLRGPPRPEMLAAFRESLILEAVNAARRTGRDEFLAQAMVVPTGPLHIIENMSTGERMLINQAELEAYFAGGLAVPPAPPSDPTAIWPAGQSVVHFLSAAVAGNYRTDVPTKRVDLSVLAAKPGGITGAYRQIGSLGAGDTAVVLDRDLITRLRLSSGTAGNEADLQAHFGAKSVVVLAPNWSEKLASFIGHPVVTGILIAVFLVCMFIEMTHPGVVVPGLIALVCFVALSSPGFVAGIASWWAIAAVVAGILLLIAELFFIPGFGVAGVAGLILLFGGLIFAIAPASTAYSTAEGQEALLRAAVTVVLSVVTALFGMFVIIRRLGTIPILSRYALRTPDPGEVDEEIFGVMPQTELPVRVGDRGVATTPLRPSGKAEFDEEVVDVVADFGVISEGTEVEVISADRFRIVVARVDAPRG